MKEGEKIDKLEDILTQVKCICWKMAWTKGG